METIEKTTNSLFGSLGFKMGLIAFLTLLLLIPANMILGLIREREQRRDETIREVTSVWGNSQTLCGPILTVPFKLAVKTGQNEYQINTTYAHFLPENLKVEGLIEPEVRYRGIYKVVTYRTKLHVTGNFPAVDVATLNLDKKSIAGGHAWVEIGIPDMRGINQNIQFTWGDSVQAIIPGIPSTEISGSGVHCDVPYTPAASCSFAFDLDMNGSYSLNFIPIGKETNVSLTSSWNTPSFSGAFLPDERKITNKGFSAEWNILQLNRNYPQQWINNQYTLEGSSFGVDLITPVDIYQKSTRSVKYAILFIGLTFITFFFSEVFTKIRIHAVNYVLVGIALCVFYSLLVALAEQLPFAFAYIAASLIIITMIAIFAHSLYKKWQVTLTVTASLVALYIFLFVILQLMDYSLLFGNIGLVIVLALVMYFSRKIDWYAKVRSSGNDSSD